MEKPHKPEGKSSLEIGTELAAALEQMYHAYRNGSATQQDLLRILNDIQRLNYNELKKQNPDRFVANYDEVAVSHMTTDNYLYTHLLAKHPVIEEILKNVQERTDFIFWYQIFSESYPEAVLPTEGTASDIFKATLRHLLQDYGQRLHPKTISDITLRYVLKPTLTASDYIAAEQIITNGFKE